MHLLGTRLPELSQGSAQKVGIVQALLARPDLLVLDEPFAALDADARHELHAIVRETAAAGGIVVVSDHQGHLRDIPDRTRWHVAETGITVSSAQQQTHSTADADDLSETTIVEVTVPTREAGHLAATLRADGHHVRVRDGGTSEPRHSE